MALKKFNEYMNSKGGINKPKVDASGDQVDIPKGRDTKPPKAEKSMKTNDEGGKVTKEMTAQPKPYVSKGHKTLDKWDSANADLKYEPDTKTEEFLNDTKQMGMAEFVKHIANKYAIKEEAWGQAPTISTPHGSFVPMPHETFAMTRFLILNNENLMEAFVREIKRNNGLEDLVQELLKHSEAYTEIAALMGENQAISNRLVRSLKLSEMVSVPKHKDVPEDLGIDDEEDEMGPPDDEEDDSDHPALSDEDDDEDGPPEDEDMGPDMGDDMGMGDDMAPPEDPRMMMKKKKSGMHFLRKAMGMY